MPESTPTIYVDLIEERPFTPEQFRQSRDADIWPATNAADDDLVAAEYQEYLAKFQPWRVLVLSGDNQRRLFRSTERYFNEVDARHAVELAFGNQSNVYLRQAEHGNIELRLASGG